VAVEGLRDAGGQGLRRWAARGAARAGDHIFPGFKSNRAGIRAARSYHGAGVATMRLSRPVYETLPLVYAAIAVIAWLIAYLDGSVRGPSSRS